MCMWSVYCYFPLSSFLQDIFFFSAHTRKLQISLSVFLINSFQIVELFKKSPSVPVEEFLRRNKMEKIFIVDSDMFRRGERVRDGGTVDLQCSNCKQSSSRIILERMIELQWFGSLKFKEKKFFHNCNLSKWQIRQFY